MYQHKRYILRYPPCIPRLGGALLKEVSDSGGRQHEAENFSFDGGRLRRNRDIVDTWYIVQDRDHIFYNYRVARGPGRRCILRKDKFGKRGCAHDLRPMARRNPFLEFSYLRDSPNSTNKMQGCSQSANRAPGFRFVLQFLTPAWLMLEKNLLATDEWTFAGLVGRKKLVDKYKFGILLGRYDAYSGQKKTNTLEMVWINLDLD